MTHPDYKIYKLFKQSKNKLNIYAAIDKDGEFFWRVEGQGPHYLVKGEYLELWLIERILFRRAHSNLFERWHGWNFGASTKLIRETLPELMDKQEWELTTTV